MKAVHDNIKDADLSCSQCEKSFMSRQSLNYHIDVVHTSSSAEVKCPVCDAKLGHSVSLERHMKLHKESLELHQCSLCQKQFTRKDNLTVHKKVVHGSVNLETSMTELSRQDKDSFACRVCGVKFSGERAEKELVAHLVNKCRADQRVSCNKCDRDFSSQFNMKQHERSFHNNVPKITFLANSVILSLSTKLILTGMRRGSIQKNKCLNFCLQPRFSQGTALGNL